MISAYLLIGLGVWAGLFAIDYKTILTKFTPWEVAKGFLGSVFLWPLALYVRRER